MARLPIRTFPDPVLLETAKPVTTFDDKLATLAKDMAETMYAADGVGLAAPQVGLSIRLIVLDVASEEQRGRPMTFVNPEILRRETEIDWEEGCLSLPGITVPTKRSGIVTVKAQDLAGNSFEVTGDGLLAVALQHEIDHLEGRLLLDHASRLKRPLLERELKRKKLKELGVSI